MLAETIKYSYTITAASGGSGAPSLAQMPVSRAEATTAPAAARAKWATAVGQRHLFLPSWGGGHGGSGRGDGRLPGVRWRLREVRLFGECDGIQRFVVGGGAWAK